MLLFQATKKLHIHPIWCLDLKDWHFIQTFSSSICPLWGYCWRRPGSHRQLSRSHLNPIAAMLNSMIFLSRSIEVIYHQTLDYKTNRWTNLYVHCSIKVKFTSMLLICTNHPSNKYKKAIEIEGIILRVRPDELLKMAGAVTSMWRC